MRVLSLDISSRTGWSVFADGKLTDYGMIEHKVKGKFHEGNYPLNIIESAEKMATDLCAVAKKYDPHFIVIEETNLGKNRYSQKQLEFIHCVVCINIEKYGQIKYLDSSEWRSSLSMGLSTDQRKSNKKIKDEREEKKLELETQWWKDNKRAFLKETEELKKRESNKIKKTYDGRCNKYISDGMRKFKTINKKVGFKHLSVSYVNANYGFQFKLKDNDIADSICLGEAFIKILQENIDE